MMNDIPLTLQEQLTPLFFKKDVYSGKLCEKGKEIRRLQLELMKRGEPQGSPSAEQIFDLRQEGASKETLLRSQRLIEETTYLTAKLRALEREIDGVLTQELLVTRQKEGAEGSFVDPRTKHPIFPPKYLLGVPIRGIEPGSVKERRIKKIHRSGKLSFTERKTETDHRDDRCSDIRRITETYRADPQLIQTAAGEPFRELCCRREIPAGTCEEHDSVRESILIRDHDLSPRDHIRAGEEHQERLVLPLIYRHPADRDRIGTTEQMPFFRDLLGRGECCIDQLIRLDIRRMRRDQDQPVGRVGHKRVDKDLSFRLFEHLCRRLEDIGKDSGRFTYAAGRFCKNRDRGRHTQRIASIFAIIPLLPTYTGVL